jgi:AcrR family transcriptional regulator
MSRGPGREVHHAARELLTDTATGDATVRLVAEQSGQSIGSLYQHFSSKHDLMLAMSEEDVASAARQVAQKVAV